MENSKQDFFRKTGLNYSNFTGKSKDSDLSSKSVAEIITMYPEINPTWLLTGKGEMTLSRIQNIEIEGGNNKNFNNINGSTNVTISQIDATDVIDIIKSHQKQLSDSQNHLTVSQNQINTLIDIINKKI
ncbi:MAG: hypothetical protein N4435_00675 [Candidatus Ornithobacterium hominis]|uniref:hypothetical protein n=1 Tax=Candidatus Ornithobacterium hominis TaxID=2497989 RepID=UPI0010589FA7|nr:hypothetical protein [Candidatus Ornithobacterium hominis]MCT7903708.1 hypothetical protein [Candidatus Ornithobacterium hominis]